MAALYQMSIETWSINQVSDWIKELGFERLSAVFKREKIDGECLVFASHEMLKELEIDSLQDRITILNHIYNQKLNFGIEIEEGDYEPGLASLSPVTYENQRIQQNSLKKKQEEREYIVNILARQLQEINLELNAQKLSSKHRPSAEESYSPRNKQSIAQQMKSPQKSPIAANLSFSPDRPSTPLSVKQEQILKSAMELYGNKPKQSSKGWNFL